MTPTSLAAQQATESQTPATATTTTTTVHQRRNKSVKEDRVRRSLRVEGMPYAEILDMIPYLGPKVDLQAIMTALRHCHAQLTAKDRNPSLLAYLADEMANVLLAMNEVARALSNDQRRLATLVFGQVSQVRELVTRQDGTEAAGKLGEATNKITSIIELLGCLQVDEAQNYREATIQMVEAFRRKVGRLYIKRVFVPAGPELDPTVMLACDYIEGMNKQARAQPVLAGYLVAYEWEGKLCIGGCTVDFMTRYKGRFHKNMAIWQAIRNSAVPTVRLIARVDSEATKQARQLVAEGIANFTNLVTAPLASFGLNVELKHSMPTVHNYTEVAESPQQTCARVPWNHDRALLERFYLETKLAIEDWEEKKKAKEAANKTSATTVENATGKEPAKTEPEPATTEQAPKAEAVSAE